MPDSKAASGRTVIVAAAISLSAGFVGVLCGRIFVAALSSSPAWLGPAIVIGSIALLLAGFLLLPTALRASRGFKSGGGSGDSADRTARTDG